jgi:hypothetical protein
MELNEDIIAITKAIYEEFDKRNYSSIPHDVKNAISLVGYNPADWVIVKFREECVVEENISHHFGGSMTGFTEHNFEYADPAFPDNLYKLVDDLI